jgi:serine phosphatase RsbU (regulator of sigma subunit)/anti-sigma regulatory factor (Ser/Thr protein kinase)
LLVAQVPVDPPSGGQIGTTLVGMNRTYLDSALADSRRGQFLLLVAVLVVGGGLTFGLMSLLMRPVAGLRHGLERIGRGDLDTPIDVRDRTELGLLAEAVNQMAARLKTAQRAAVERERLAREVELARSIQQSLLPKGRMVAGPFELEGAQRAAAEVGGDYYDLLPVSQGRIGIAVADVSGKGLAGCLVMSMLSALLRALRHAYRSPAQLLVALEETLVQSLPRGGFVTMFYGVLDPGTGRLVYASAGHTPMLVIRAASGTFEWRRARSVPIGAVRNGALARMLKDEVVDLGPGDVAVHFTDGFNEAQHHHTGEQFGLDRIAAVVQRSAARGPRAIIDALTLALSEWTGAENPQDDETVLVVGRTAGEPTALPAAASVQEQPLDWLAEARSIGQSLTLGARFEDLVLIRGWLEQCTDLCDLSPRAIRLLESALYEVCANVVEHGYGLAPGRTFDLWWVAAAADVDNADLAARVRNGYLLIHDRGKVFRPPHRPFLDFHDPRVRRKGRGLGLDMIRRIMNQISYHPGTPEGNLTRLVFDPARITSTQEDGDE